jgi:hypothetical protein
MNGGHGIILTYESSNERKSLDFSKKRKYLFINSIYPIFLLSTQKEVIFLYRKLPYQNDERK